MEKFLSWASKNGADYEKLEFKNFGVFGLGDLKENETIVSIPLDLMINYRVVQKTEFGKKLISLYEKSEKLQKNISLVQKDEKDGSSVNNAENFGFNMSCMYLFLACESKNPNSFWKDYFPVLPKSYDTALYFTEQDVKELEGKSTIGIKKRLESLYNALFPLLTEMDSSISCTYDELKWAYSTVWSRAFPIQYENEVVPSLMPVVSILNHKYNAKISYFTDVQNNRFCLQTLVPLTKGGQVFNNYGGKSNESFLFSYGFIVDNNTEDTFYVQIGLRENNEEFYTKKLNLIQELDLKFGYYIRKDKLPEDLLRTLRICVMNEEDFYFYDKTKEIQGFANEFEMIKTLKTLLIRKREKFPTTNEEDEKILSKTENYKSRCIIIYRMGQKEIIDLTLKRLDEMSLKLVKPEENREIIKDPIDWKLFFYNENDQLVFTSKTDKYQLLAKNNIDKLTEFYSTKKFLTKECYQKSKLAKIFTFDDETNMIIYLIYLKYKAKSKWKPFINSLPQKFNTPLFSQDLSILQGTPVLEEIVEMKNHIHELVEDLIPLTKALNTDILNFDNVRWAFTVYNMFSVDGILIPLPIQFDYNPSKLFIQYFEKDTFYLRSISDFKENEKISTNFYLSKNNNELLSTYGFIIKNNPNSTVQIILNPSELKITQQKLQILQKNNLGLDHYLKKNVYPEKLVKSLRVCFLTKEEFKQEELNLKEKIKNEEKVVKTITDLLNGYLEEFSSDLKEDLQLLEKINDPMKKTFLEYSIEIKEILVENLKFFQP